MLSAKMKQVLSDVLNHEAKLALIELEAMARMQDMGWHGFKRMFKCRSKDRFKHLTYLKKCIVDYGHENVPFKVEYTSPSGDSTFSSIIGSVHKESEEHLKRLKLAMGMAFEELDTMIGEKLEYLVKDQSRECLKLRRVVRSWENAQRMNDTSWLSRIDAMKHSYYSKKNPCK